MNPQPVTIIQPRRTIPENIGLILGSLANLAISAWIVMLLTPVVWQPIGYWQAVAATWIGRALIGNTSEHNLWSKAARR